MAKRKAQRELTPRQWQDRWCAEAGHEPAAIVVRGRPVVICLECDAYMSYQAALGRSVKDVAGRHFTAN